MPKIYRMTRVTFGVVSCPFLAIGTIGEHVKMCKETFPVASSEILRNTYDDDFCLRKRQCAGNTEITVKCYWAYAESCL